jgi:hypothetical protein
MKCIQIHKIYANLWNKYKQSNEMYANLWNIYKFIVYETYYRYKHMKCMQAYEICANLLYMKHIIYIE